MSPVTIPEAIAWRILGSSAFLVFKVANIGIDYFLIPHNTLSAPQILHNL